MNRHLFKIAGFVGIITVISKLFGLGRDLVIAQYFGTSMVSDAYNFAYLLTGNALILLGGLGGPFHSATIATLTKIKDNSKEAGSFLIKIFSSTFFFLSLITLVIYFFRDPIIHLIAPAHGLNSNYQEKLWHFTSLQLQIMLPLVIISGLLGILCGVSNVYKNFFWPSFSPVLPSIAIIFFILVYPDKEMGLVLGIGTLIGAFLQLAVQVPDLLKAGLYENLKIALLGKQKVVSDFYYFLGPALLSTTIGQLTVYIDSFFCSGLEEGSWTATVFANRLIQLPLGVLLTSFLVPFFPRFSELAHEKNLEGLKSTSVTVIRSLWFLTLPVAVYLFLFAKPLVELIFQRGAFNERSTMLTSSILIALLLSMIFYVARDTLTRVFYSLGDSRTPLLIAIFSILMKIILNSWLVRYNAPGIAFATSLVTVFNFLLLAFLLRKKIGLMHWSTSLITFLKLILASIIMFFAGYTFIHFYPQALYNGSLLLKALSILSSFVLCFLIYFGLSLLLKVEEAGKIIKEIKSKIL